MLPKWRKATWAFAIWNIFTMLWLATALDGVSDASCAGESGAALAVCNAGVNIGLSLGLSFVLIVWVVGLIAFGLIWLASRPRSVMA